MPIKPKLVAIAYDLNFREASAIFSGVSNFIQENGLNWQLLPLNFGFEAKLMELAQSERLNGAIGTFVSDEWIRGLDFHGVFAVNLFNFSRIETVPTVSLDDAAIGKTAASHLLEQGAKSLSFIGQDEAYFNQIRRAAFSESCPPDIFHNIDPRAPRRAQAASLKDLASPSGVLCSNDRVARELCNEAKLIGIEVGRDLLVIGIGNEPAESIFAGIGLSSFDIPAKKIGYRAAEELNQQFDTNTFGEPIITKSSIKAKLVSRESTLATPQARLAERALSEIRESIAQADFDIAQLSRHLGVSRRSLELTTRERLGKSPYQILSEQRLKRAKEHLKQSNESITKIGEACGYPEPHHFSAWFKNRTQLSPKNYRLANQTKKD